MKLKVGGVYRTRCGYRVVIEQKLKSHWEFYGYTILPNGNKSDLTFTENGRYGGTYGISKYDILDECSEVEKLLFT